LYTGQPLMVTVLAAVLAATVPMAFSSTPVK